MQRVAQVYEHVVHGQTLGQGDLVGMLELGFLAALNKKQFDAML